MSVMLQDRVTAGRDLARALLKYRKHADVAVLALPRGGVPVAAEVARELHAPLDILVVRKLGTPGHEELAMGAIASGGIRVLNPEIIEALGMGSQVIEEVAAREQLEIERRMKAYRGERPWLPIEGRRLILVDDGIATGATMRAAIAAVRTQNPGKVIVAVPVASCETIVQLRRQADEIVCLATPEPFGAVGIWYASFPQVADEEVRRVLSQRWAEYDAAVAPGTRAQRPGGAQAPSEGATADRDAQRSRAARPARKEEVRIPVGSLSLEGTLTSPADAHGLVVFVHGSGSSRFSRRNRHVAESLNAGGLATLLFDLFTAEEDAVDARAGELRFDIALSSDRLIGVLDWLEKQPAIRPLSVGLFGASTGAAAALKAAAARPKQVKAVVSRGGRPDLAHDALPSVLAPTLLIVGGLDDVVIHLNERAAARLRCEHCIEIVPGATHLFEESGKLDAVACLAREWFKRHLHGPGEPLTESRSARTSA
jgi:putative phosphoribosyl transferase